MLKKITLTIPILISFTSCYAERLDDLEIMLQAVLTENAEAKKQIQLLQKKSKISAARAVCYSALSSKSSHALILIPLKSNKVDLESQCNTIINPTWHAIGVAKSDHYNENCKRNIGDLVYKDGSYTSYASKSFFDNNRKNYTKCKTDNAFICCSRD